KVTRRASAWISTSQEQRIAETYSNAPYKLGQPYMPNSDTGFVYGILQDGGVSVDDTISFSLDNLEVAYSEPIPWQNVFGYGEAPAAGPVTWTPNPSFTGDLEW